MFLGEQLPQLHLVQPVWLLSATGKEVTGKKAGRPRVLLIVRLAQWKTWLVFQTSYSLTRKTGSATVFELANSRMKTSCLFALTMLWCRGSYEPISSFC